MNSAGLGYTCHRAIIKIIPLDGDHGASTGKLRFELEYLGISGSHAVFIDLVAPEEIEYFPMCFDGVADEVGQEDVPGAEVGIVVGQQTGVVGQNTPVVVEIQVGGGGFPIHHQKSQLQPAIFEGKGRDFTEEVE